ncbi:diacylglycerol/lipid kinase family protein [Flavihumibacter fluvii]|uniref:diacylglycerol/lipid kinase family protein n=1 Tax=Flavihumibacter fluvii TaxID=2838157 RepID=UPI001BDF2524|nr:diacylglycerol kinase family protein [Flavihumibacter fluvii]ULQ52870.1 hypothetical protein KJS93_00885 [Flavihumibacter fluvii]
MQKPIAILCNPRAGKHRSAKIFQTITSKLVERSIPFHGFEEEWPDQLNGFSAAWLIGGDGTLNYFINHYRQARLPLAIFKGGTGNDFAEYLYGKANTTEMVDIILQARPKPIDAGICNGQLFLNTIGIGFDGKVLEQMNTIRWMGSFFGYYTAIIKNIFTFKEPLYSIQSDQQQPVKGRFLLVLVSNAPTTGGGFKVSPFARPDDGALNVITCGPLSVIKRLCSLPSVRTGNHLRFPFIHHHTIQSIQIDCALRVPAQVDGELMVTNSFTCNVLPKHYLFLY